MISDQKSTQAFLLPTILHQVATKDHVLQCGACVWPSWLNFVYNFFHIVL